MQIFVLQVINRIAFCVSRGIVGCGIEHHVFFVKPNSPEFLRTKHMGWIAKTLDYEAEDTKNIEIHL